MELPVPVAEAKITPIVGKSRTQQLTSHTMSQKGKRKQLSKQESGQRATKLKTQKKPETDALAPSPMESKDLTSEQDEVMIYLAKVKEEARLKELKKQEEQKKHEEELTRKEEERKRLLTEEK